MSDIYKAQSLVARRALVIEAAPDASLLMGYGYVDHALMILFEPRVVRAASALIEAGMFPQPPRNKVRALTDEHHDVMRAS